MHDADQTRELRVHELARSVLALADDAQKHRHGRRQVRHAIPPERAEYVHHAPSHRVVPRRRAGVAEHAQKRVERRGGVKRIRRGGKVARGNRVACLVVAAVVVEFVHGGGTAVHALATPQTLVARRRIRLQVLENAGVGAVRLVSSRVFRLFILRLVSPHASDALHGEQALAVQPLLVILVRQRVQRAEDTQRAQGLRARLAALLDDNAQKQPKQMRVLGERTHGAPGRLDPLSERHDGRRARRAGTRAVHDERQNRLRVRRNALGAHLRDLANRAERGGAFLRGHNRIFVTAFS